MLFLAALCGVAGAQEGDAPNGVLLVAKPGMPDPRFRETVILATQAPDGHTVGVILNRPTDAKLSAFSTDPRAHAYDGAVGYGGPVLDGAIVAMFRSPSRPAAPAFHALRGVYLSMHPRALEQALAAPPRDVRFYLGFSGWTPGQLRTELKEGWHVLPATEEIAFRADTSGLWAELIEKTRRFRTSAAPLPRAILVP